MRTYVFVPPLKRPTGGSRALVDLARLLNGAGRPTSLVAREPLAEQPEGVDVLPWERLALTTDDVWVVPEGWPNALAPGLAAAPADRPRCVVYVQNHAYLFSALPPGADWRSLPVRFLAVSQPVAWHIRQALGAESRIVRSAVDLATFTPPDSKPPSAGPLTVAFMPRKNKAVAERVREITQARGLALRWEAIDGLPPEGVAQALGRAHIFLATGFPEGLGLPPLEAMACGCLPVGCAGLGGWDYMRQAMDFAGACAPWLPLRDVPWGGNGLWVADGDFLAAAQALELAAGLWRGGGPRLAAILADARSTAQAYGRHAMGAEAADAWAELEDERGEREKARKEGAPQPT